MNRSSEPGERTQQHSVAELLARYGGEAPTSGRRRRRDPEDDCEAPQSIIERVRTDSGPLPTVDPPRRRRSADAEPAEPSGYQQPPPAPEDDGFSGGFGGGGAGPVGGLGEGLGGTERNGHRRPEADDSGWNFAGPDWQLDRRGHGERDDRGRPDRDGGGPGPAAVDGRGRSATDDYGLAPPELNGQRNGHGPAPATSNGHFSGAYRSDPGFSQDTWIGLPPMGAGSEPLNGRALNGRALSSGPPTDKLPKLDPALLDAAPLHPSLLDPVEQPDTALLGSAPLGSDPADSGERWPHGGEPPAGLGTGTQLIPAEHEGDRVADGSDPAWDDTEQANAEQAAAAGVIANRTGADDQQALDLDEEPEEFVSPLREWIVMVTQISIGVVGGAVLWLVCEWLWQRIPVVALVVALAVITGLVWVVRRVRRAEDLQTTVIAVLVGLFVTVSPAALLLVGR